MHIEYIKTKKIDEEFIDNYKRKNDIEFNIYGRYKNLLFLNKDNCIKIYDIDKKLFVHYCGNKVHLVKSNDSYYFFQYLQDKDGDIYSICIYDEKLKVENFLSLKEHYELKPELNMECLSSNDEEEKYYVGWSCYPYRGSFHRINHGINFTINKKNDIELALSSSQLKEQTGKITDYYINAQKERITNDKWDGMSKFKYRMAIISKDNLYGVINENYEIVFDYNPDIVFINILSFNTLLIENKNNEKFLYNINAKEMTKYSEEIQLDVKMLKENIYKKQVNNKYELYINNKLYDGIYDDIYIKEDLDIIILEQNGKTTFIDTKGNQLFKLNNNNYYIVSNDIYYKEKNEIFIFNLKTLQSKLLGNSLLKTDDNKTVSYENKKTFNTYKYFYNDPETNEIILCKNMKYGIIIKDQDIKVLRWFDSSEKRKEIHKMILENMFPKEVDENKVLTKKKLF